MSVSQRILAAILLASWTTPAYASDFTGMGTVFAAAYGIVFLLSWGSMFAFSRMLSVGPLRTAYLIAGPVIGAVLTVWWFNVPIAERSALLIFLTILLIAGVVAAAFRKVK